MALIKCPECNKEISDKSSCCVHCGYPLVKKESIVNKAQSQINESSPMWLFSENDSSVYIECGNCNKVYSFSKKYFPDINNEYCKANTPIVCPNCSNGVASGKKIRRKIVKSAEDRNVIKCKRCGSTSVTVGTRGYSLLWGFIGSGKTTNRCGKCGYTWQP